MSKQGYRDEIDRALARPDADQMRRQLRSYAEHYARGGKADWPEDLAADFDEIICCHFDDPEKSFAYVMIALSENDDPGFLGLMGCGNLENVLADPSPEFLKRIVAEARKSAQFRWLLSHPFKVAIAERAWEAIEPFRITGPHEEPLAGTFPLK